TSSTSWSEGAFTLDGVTISSRSIAGTRMEPLWWTIRGRERLSGILSNSRPLSRLERVVSKELHDPFRSAGRVFVATRMDPGHYWVCSVSPINGASVPAGGAFPSHSVYTPRDFDGALLIRKRYLGILYTCNVKQR